MPLSYRSAGESHGPAVLAVLEGIPAGMEFPEEAVHAMLRRRQGGYGRGARQRIEEDRVEVLSGLRQGRTLGSPLTLVVKNRDHRIDELGPVTRPRPGHADLAGAWKLGVRDARGVLERASARETAARVAAGAVCAAFLARFGLRVDAHVVAIGEVDSTLIPEDPDERRRLRDASEVYCPDPEASVRMVDLIAGARRSRDTAGGVFEVVARGVPPGLGSWTQWDLRLDCRLAGALMSVQAIKGVEVGLGFRAARLAGSRVHDPIEPDPEGPLPYRRTRNHAGGLEGGTTNGEPVVVRAAMKPLSTLMDPLPSVDLETGEAAAAAVERSDTCAVPAASVVGEAVVAYELARAFLEAIGGSSMDDVEARYVAYRERLRGL
ncbi:MAG: chorismate synthase [Planctomycetes bacterium]|nr:chorismate synthase [Planctomycetota bacterium]